VVCFFIPVAHRGRGVAAQLLKAAVELARDRGAPALEGYPVRTVPGERYAATFAHIGVPRLFEQAGFRDITPEGQARPVYRRTFRRRMNP
jgi:GNAT superfamily N-acetyltransferase